MRIRVFEDGLGLGRAAAEEASDILRRTIAAKGAARLVVATGRSQLDFLDAFTRSPGVEWAKVELFHLSEYVGLGPDHPASYRRVVYQAVVSRTGIRRFHPLDGDHFPERTCR